MPYEPPIDISTATSTSTGTNKLSPKSLNRQYYSCFHLVGTLCTYSRVQWERRGELASVLLPVPRAVLREFYKRL